MADYRSSIDYILRWEGGISTATTDSAVSAPGNQDGPRNAQGKLIHTNKGIQWQSYKALAPRVSLPVTHSAFLGLWSGTRENPGSWDLIFKVGYWDAVGGDNIAYQPVADLLADYAWGSGPGTAIRAVQGVLNERFGAGLVVDGAIGPKTLAAINKANGPQLFEALFAEREAFLRSIAARDPQFGAPNLQGWLNRIYDFYQEKKTS